MKEHFNEKPYRKRSITQYSNLNRNSTEKENEKLNHVGYIFLVLTFPLYVTEAQLREVSQQELRVGQPLKLLFLPRKLSSSHLVMITAQDKTCTDLMNELSVKKAELSK